MPVEQRLEIVELGGGFHRVVAHFGFMEDADVPDVLAQARAAGLPVEGDDLTYVLSRAQLLPAAASALSRWRRALFFFLFRNELEAERFFRLPPNRVLELWLQAEI